MADMKGAARTIAVAAAIAPLLALGCSHTPGDAELAKVYRVGLTRGEAAALHGERPQVAERPAAGWATAELDPRDAVVFAGQFEGKTSNVVGTCEVYTVPRGFLGMGIYWDYLFFDADGRLLGFRRRLVD